MALLRMIFWIGIFLVSTFAFTVLFQHGITNYAQNAEKEWAELQRMANSHLGGKKEPGTR